MNFDETPLPFEWLEGKTYDFKDAKSINTKTDRGGGLSARPLLSYIFLLIESLEFHLRLYSMAHLQRREGDLKPKKVGNITQESLSNLTIQHTIMRS